MSLVLLICVCSAHSLSYRYFTFVYFQFLLLYGTCATNSTVVKIFFKFTMNICKLTLKHGPQKEHCKTKEYLCLTS